MKTRPAALSCALLFGGCAASSWRDRAHDFAQIVDASASFGPGVAANVRVTALAPLGAGSFDGVTAGVIDGRLAQAREQRSELGVSLLHTYEVRREGDDLLDIRHPHYADPGYDPHPLSWQMESDRHAADVGLGLHLAYVGVSVALHPDALWDFVAGCFGFDPAHDDAFARPIEALEQQALSLDAPTRDAAFDALMRRGHPIHGYAVYTATGCRPSYQRRAIDAIQTELNAGAGAAAPTAK